SKGLLRVRQEVLHRGRAWPEPTSAAPQPPGPPQGPARAQGVGDGDVRRWRRRSDAPTCFGRRYPAVAHGVKRRFPWFLETIHVEKITALIEIEQQTGHEEGGRHAGARHAFPHV